MLEVKSLENDVMLMVFWFWLKKTQKTIENDLKIYINFSFSLKKSKKARENIKRYERIQKNYYKRYIQHFCLWNHEQ